MLNAPVVVLRATTADDGGDWFVASDCGSFALDAPYPAAGWPQ